MTTAELLKKAEKPNEDAMKLHPFYQGKIEIALKAPVRNLDDFAIWYTPGVAAPCLDIQKNPEKVYEHTNKGNTVAIVSDGTRVLGLGDIGPEAGLPVMEGKALLFKYLGGVDAFPICIKKQDTDEFVEVVKSLEPSFGGINLEDISKPKCFHILEKLRNEMNIPVWHDDQQGTATVIIAGLMGALKVVNKQMDNIDIAMIGVGANYRITKCLVLAGCDPKRIIMTDSKGILNKGRKDLNSSESKEKWEMCLETNGKQKTGGIKETLEGADACIALSASKPGLIKKEWLSAMNKDAIVFACANPLPEIWPWDAKKAGVRIIGTGRSDFPNQVNNSLGFPGIFRGVLDVWAKTITDSMVIAAAKSLARSAELKGLNENYIIPKMDDPQVFVDEAVACGLEAIKEGIARRELSADELRRSAEQRISHSRDETELLMEQGIIKKVPI